MVCAAMASDLTEMWSIRWTKPAGAAAASPSDKGIASTPNAESAFKDSLSDQGAKTSIAVTGRSPGRAQRAAAKGAGGTAATELSPSGSRPRTVSSDKRAVASSLEGAEGAVSLRAMMQRQPFRHQPQVEYYALPAGVKVMFRLL